MNKKKLLLIPTSLCTMVVLSGCNRLHVHDYSGEYFHNETEHWQVCSKCGEKINLELHSFNQLNDTCLICKYKDPICLTSEEHHMTGLTKHGKTKLEVNVPNGITFIDNYAFKDSSTVTVNLTKDIIGIYKDAFTDSKVTIVNTEEEMVNWVEYNGVYYKDDIIKNYEALIDKVPYVKLEDAFMVVSQDNTTITLLKDKYHIGTPITINNTITLEAYQSQSAIEADFNIGPNGWLKIPQNITYQGTTKLQLVETIERCLESENKVYSSGSLIFSKTGEKPQNVDVYYVDNFDESSAKITKKVKGNKQIVNESVIFENDYYVYGTFILSLDFSKILGLTAFGKNITGLTITNPFDEDNNTIEIGTNAFVTMGRMDIDIGVKTIVVRGHLQKGAFHHVVIDNTVTKIGNGAFSTRVTHDASAEFRKLIALITSPLYTLDIGSGVKEIEDKAFEDCESLEKVIGGRSLERIGGLSFGSCANLKSVDLSEALNLIHIQDQAFGDCIDLKSVKLPTDGWTINGCGYLPTDMTPEITAFLLIKQHRYDKWERTLGGTVCAYDPNQKDGDGRCNKVKYYPTLQEAINHSNNGFHVYMTEKAATEIDGLTVNHMITLECNQNKSYKIKGNITVEKNCYLLVTSDNIAMEEDANVTLKRNTPSGNEYQGVGGLAIIKTSNSSNANLPNVKFENSANAVPSLAKIDTQVYNAWGLYKFDVHPGTGYENRETITSRTEFCSKFTEVTVDIQLADAPADRYIWLNDSCFKGVKNGFKTITLSDKVVRIYHHAFRENEVLEKVILGSGLTNIYNNAFYNCHKLQEIDFTRCVNLEEIGDGCFGGCGELKEISLHKTAAVPLKKIGSKAFENSGLERFDLGINYQNWKHNGQALEDTRTSTPAFFAQDLRINYMTHTFTREIK